MSLTRHLGFLTETSGSPAAYILKAGLVAIAGTIGVTLILSPFLPTSEASESDQSAMVTGFVLVVVWPIITTAVLSGLLGGTKRVMPTYWHAAAVSALGFSVVIGGLLGPIVGVVHAWPLFVYAVAFLAWQLISNTHAWTITIILHAAVNLIPSALLF